MDSIKRKYESDGYSRDRDRHKESERHKGRDSHRQEKNRHEQERNQNEHKTLHRRSQSDSSQSSEDKRSRSGSRSRSRHGKKRKGRSRSRDSFNERSKQRDGEKHKKKKKKTEKHKSPPATVNPTKTKEDVKKEKELLKALETPEEKRARRLAKKLLKGRHKKAQMGWDDDYMGYTNADNPFGDEHLLDTFLWKKKLEKEGKKDLTKEDIEKLQKKKMLENKLELEKVKKRRLEREREKEEREKEQEMMQRDKEADYFRAWEKQEDTFHLQQAKLRSKIRIGDGRAKPIDLMAHYISLEDDDFAFELQEPYKYLHGLTVTDLEDLLEDIKVYVELEQGKNVSFWRDITIITEDELDKLRKLDPDSQTKYVVERRTGINSSVVDDITNVFRGKTLTQLNLLEQSIQQKLKGGEGVDVGYWETLLHQLKAHMARQRLRERHQEELKRKLFKLKQEQGIDSAPLFPIMQQSDQSTAAAASSSAAAGQSSSQQSEFKVPRAAAAAEGGNDKGEGDQEDEVEEEEDEEEDEESKALQACCDEYDKGPYSPTLIAPTELPPDVIIYDPEEDIKKLEFARRQVQLTGQAEKDEEEDLIRTAKQGMNAEECQFSVEAPLRQALPVWSDKYRPRKPRFFNRVHTGFEWNKYNQTHYDIDNPPPKIVQGYKFNIFYPDLINKTKTPQHFVTPCEDNEEFGILRFHAGPPYEDIAFKIVNKEWEYSYKRGFRCQFYNNIFQLWFHFKRYRYRR